MIAPHLGMGVGFHAAGALLSANCYAPQKYVKHWSWEIFWMTQAAWCWLLLPILGAIITIPNLSLVLAEFGRLDEAAAAARHVLQLQPRNADARNNLGQILARQQKMPEAEEQLRAAVGLDPQHPLARFNLGLLLELSGRRAEAQSEYEAALRLRPGMRAAESALRRLRQ